MSDPVRPPWWDGSWRSWLYGLAWLGGGVAWTLVGIWLVSILIDPDLWSPNTQPQRIGILGMALYLSLSVPILVMVGLGLRSAIRSIKIGGPAGSSFEATSHRGDHE
jgi:hypothetical protein